MRIAIDTTPAQLGGGGVATYLRELLTALYATAEVEVVELDHSPTSSGLHRIAAGVQREAWYYPRGLERAARAVGSDLIHVPAATPARARTLPLVLTIHDAIPWRHPEWFTRANALQQRLLVGRAARHADLVLTDSHASKCDIVELLRVDAARVKVIHLGIAPAFSPRLRDTAWLGQRFGITGPTVLSVGTPEPRKNLAGTLATFDIVAQAVPEATLLLVGGAGWRSADLDARIAKTRGRVIKVGRVAFEDLTRIYASADCFLFPSLLEGFGFPPLEAMASGLPVVCSDRPSLPEVVGEAATTRAPDDHAGLAEAVLELLQSEPAADAARAAGIAQASGFTWERTAADTIAAYRSVLAQ